MQLSTRIKVAIVFCGACAMVVASVHLRAVAYSDSGTSSVTKSTGQADESAFAFNLDIHLATEVPEEPSKIPDGHTVMRKDDRVFLAEAESVLTQGDLRDVRVGVIPADADGDRKKRSLVVFQLTPDAAARLASVTEQNIGKHLIIVLNDEVLAAVPIEGKMADGELDMPGEGLNERQGELLYIYRMLPFMRAVEAAGISEMQREAQDRRRSRDYLGALELCTAALPKAEHDPYLALWVRSEIVRFRSRTNDRAGAVTAATEALRDAMEALRTQGIPQHWLAMLTVSRVAHPLILWKEKASRQELAQALALLGYTVERASEEAEAARRYGQDQSLQVYQFMALWGRIHAARAKARLGDAAIVKAELEDLMGECVQPHELVRARYCLGKTLAESGEPQEAGKFLRQALADLDQSRGPDESPNDKWMREDIEQMLAEIVTADAEFNLDFHLATLVKDPTEEVPPGYQIIEKDRVRLMATTEPDLVFTEKDIRTIRLIQGRSHGEEGEAIPGDYYFVLGLAKNAAQPLAHFTGQNIGQIVAIKLNGEVVATPVIKAKIWGGSVTLARSGMSEEHQKTLLAFSGQPPEIVPGTGKIIVKARFGDGTEPLGAECRIQTCSARQPLPLKPGSDHEYLIPEVVGAYGDWTIYNVGKGPWAVSVGGSDFAWTTEANISQPVEVKSGEEKVLRFTLLHGGSVSGRVVYAETGQAASGVWVGQPSRRCWSTTDSEGRYTVRHLAPGHTSIMARAEDYVPGRSGDVQVEDEGAVTAPDIRLRRGGWISGYIVRPKEAAQRDRLGGSVMPRFEGERPLGAVISSERLSEDGELRFRLGPLPPGSYTFEANLSRGKLSTERWAGEVKGIQVKVGEEIQDVVIKVTAVNE